MAEELKKQKYANLRIPEYAGFVFGTTNHSGATLCKLNGGYIGVLEPSVDGLTSVIVEQGQKGGINRLYLFSDRINPYRREFFRVELACKLSKKYGFPLVYGTATRRLGYRFCCENFHVEISEMPDRICLEICDHQALIRDDPPNLHRTWSMSTP